MSATKSIYKVLRSFIFTALIVVTALIVGIYVALSIPSVQNAIKNKTESILTEFLGGKVEISQLVIKPFNEVQLYGVSIYEPTGKRCISVGKIGAGINLWPLISSGKIEVAYAELISLNADISQLAKDSPLNIDFIIKALSPKDNKEKKEIDLQLRNIVIRKSSLSFNRLYMPRKADSHQFDVNHLEINNLRADLALPAIKTDDYTIDLRRLAFTEKSGFVVNNLSLLAQINQEAVSVKNINVKLEQSKIEISDFFLPVDGLDKIADYIKKTTFDITVKASPLVPSDFAPFLTQLGSFNERFDLNVDARVSDRNITLNQFVLTDGHNDNYINIIGDVSNYNSADKLKSTLNKLEVRLSSGLISSVLQQFKVSDDKVKSVLAKAGNIELNCSGIFNAAEKNVVIIADGISGIADFDIKSNIDWSNDRLKFTNLNAVIDNVDLGTILDKSNLGSASCKLDGNIELLAKDINGNINLEVPYIEFNSHRFENIALEASKFNDQFNAVASVKDDLISFIADTDCILKGADTQIKLDLEVEKLFTSGLIGNPKFDGIFFSGNAKADFKGNSIDNLSGSLALTDLNFKGKKEFFFENIDLNIFNSTDFRELTLSSDVLDLDLKGNFTPSKLVATVRHLVANAIPSLIHAGGIEEMDQSGQYAQLDINIKPDSKLLSILNLPVRPAVPVVIKSDYNGDLRKISLSVDAPYFIQGKNKLIKDTYLNAEFGVGQPANVNIGTTMPIKNNYADLKLDLKAQQNHLDGDLSWTMRNNPDNHGLISLWADLYKNISNSAVEIDMGLNPSSFSIQGSRWEVDKSSISYQNKSIEVENLLIHKGSQFIDINGKASENPLDVLNVELAGIDLEYIFDVLNINYVDFGGIASGRAHVSQLFTKNPIAMTDHLSVKNLAYNNCVFGDGEIEGHWDNFRKMVAINADIQGKEGSSATVRGGVYVTRDSLSFDFGANKVDVAFLKPFVENFTSQIGGIASGNVKMYGTFSDIDLVGKAHADSVSMLVDYTNVTYSATDTVYFSPGLISFPNLKVRDSYGNSCLLEGKVTHRYLRNPGFSFEAKDIDNMLVYNTGPNSENNWYGTVFGSGEASIKGVPGYVGININLSTSKNSVFNLVLDDNQTAANYSFLTFTDKNKIVVEEIDAREQFEMELIKKAPKVEEEQIPDIFALDLLLDVTPDARMVIVMDPKAGDKISAEGRGALQMHYDSETDKFNMYGKYTLLEGNYNFSLQELILKNFLIKEGSSITFNGDPLRGILDITAAYRVNTNLADLDESFKTDPDLNRTSVPVDALLKVTGELDAPEINFDLDFPTVTADVQRRVKSIVSTEDMMNQQIIYLLALNRFYSPEYTSSQQGGELASVASSTISSQIQNIIGSLTDKFSLAPSFRSEKDNFSDMEVDVALSSRLFDNRLLLNGNLGYRDKSTSQTTFIGDFDLEYLLSRDGKLRLKAYNHFNDASYYLKSALTTQGIGIVYRKEFDDPFKFLKRLFTRRRKDNAQTKNKK